MTQPHSTAPQNKKRNVGIDLLRAISMFMIIMLHVLGQGGALDAAPIGSVRSTAFWLIEIVCLCGVNCFGVISGYVGYKTGHRLSSILRLWLEVASIIAIGNIVSVACGYLDVKTAIIQTLFPVTTRYYWFASAYIALFFFMPLIDAAIERCSRQASFVALFSFFLLASCCSLLPWGASPFSLEGGYSFIWLAYLYVLGAYYRKYGLPRLSNLRPLLLFGSTAIVVLILRVAAPAALSMHTPTWLADLGPRLDNYTSPFMLIQAVALLSLFKSMSVPTLLQRVLQQITPYIFGVYLIHTHQLIFSHILPSVSMPISMLPTPAALILAPCIGLLIFLVSLGLSIARKKLIERPAVTGMLAKADALVNNHFADRL